MNNSILFVRKVLVILLPASRRSWHSGCRLVQVFLYGKKSIGKYLSTFFETFQYILYCENSIRSNTHQSFVPYGLLSCFTRYTISSSTDANFALIAFWSWVVFAKQTGLIRFAIFGFVHSLGLFVFFRFDLVSLRSKQSERSPLGHFWVFSNSGRLYPDKCMSFVRYGS